jgi:type II secretory pathway pseudopilin PulG
MRNARLRNRGHRQPRESGSALLVVLVMAAIVAIMLYREMPQVAFEARRQQEQLLMDRAHEYQRAIQLYYRKFKPQYPPTLEALDNTNQIRFLRHRFKDPFTGKDDWRLIHTNGVALIDSRVNPLKTPGTNGSNQNAGVSSSGMNSEWFTSSGTGAFGNTTNSSSGQQPEVTVAPVKPRPAAVPAGASAPAAGADDDLNAELAQATENMGNAGDLSSNGASSSNVARGAAVSQASGADAGSAPNPMQMVRNMLSTEGPVQQQPPMASPMGAIGAPGIAGVASQAGGHSIKLINEQADYSLWEFIYDPTQDRTGTQPVPGQAPVPGQGPGNGAMPAMVPINASGVNGGAGGPGFAMQPTPNGH